ncbi:MAG: tRNA (adenosine(37)-N6)-threonylcarbamoyltransferase complex ATPase subunit type 1 TsaE [Flavobacteriales bacterium]|nr:tRNA (adenosine(37)-N6)-threonylcarbamoyltransferase complex ATPase subunit type 1 TsaE [Flavobacteriales bacterium]MCB9190423.1 tRNA (adenosine(37)-N6)-threonylcarbamoyltransferase complex ATPase subunit type 1 TsaE [Flavobacteriales bacterium]MCB9204673.1 tRNA (adenosine(37)-N6)-threonylcarbamoyltransferase complex ATPase subunit type 1 TsaE [Flavobacteriales bacterium]
MRKQSFKASTVDGLKEVCKYLAEFIKENKIILFSGEMGAGKTTLIKEFCKYLKVDDEVSSPTFSLVNEYKSSVGPVYHFDLYRIRSEEELYDIGYEDYFFSGYLCLVEWPEMAPGIIPENHILVKIQVENDQRIITVTHQP